MSHAHFHSLHDDKQKHPLRFEVDRLEQEIDRLKAQVKAAYFEAYFNDSEADMLDLSEEDAEKAWNESEAKKELGE